MPPRSRLCCAVLCCAVSDDGPRPPSMLSSCPQPVSPRPQQLGSTLQPPVQVPRASVTRGEASVPIMSLFCGGSSRFPRQLHQYSLLCARARVSPPRSFKQPSPKAPIYPLLRSSSWPYRPACTAALEPAGRGTARPGRLLRPDSCVDTRSG